MTEPTEVAPDKAAAIVLAGGRSRRLPPDKLAERLGGGTVLDATLRGLPTGLLVICVGPMSPTERAVTWVRESPPLGGPLAGVEAGLAAVPDDAVAVLIVAGDLPAAGRAVPSLLTAVRESPGSASVAVLSDATGRAQPLLAAWPRSALTDAIRALQPTNGRAAAALLDRAGRGGLVCEIADVWGAAKDIDSPDDLDAARSRTQ